MIDYFIIGRWFWLLGAILFASTIIVWMIKHKRIWLYGIAIFIWPLHGIIYYTTYLIYYYNPDLVFNLQVFANWGSVIFGQGLWTGAFIGFDIVTGWFSVHIIPRLPVNIFNGRKLV